MLTLAWDRPTDIRAVGYIVWFGKTPGRYTDSVDAGFRLQYAVDGLAEATRYCFAVQAYDASGERSELSSEVCGRTPGAPPPDDTPRPPPGEDPKGDVVVYASKAAVTKGNWYAAASAGAAGGRAMRSADRGWSAPNAPRSVPAHHFDLTFTASANTPYTIWVRLRAGGNSKWNDSVWIQFSDALVHGQARYRIGTTSALLVNLEPCAGCGPSGWGWQNSGYWLAQNATITFAKSGTHTIRVQTREDGVEIDQIVLSPSRYLARAPGRDRRDTTILPESPTARSSPLPYTGTPTAIPGSIEAAHFDHGGASIAYADTSSGNSGAAFRATDVDLQASSEGGYNIGWTAAGEWVTYTVDVQAAGVYMAWFRVASVGGGALQLAAGAPSRDVRDIAVPETRGWQSWVTVGVPITLAAGTQTITVRFLTAGINLRSIGLQRQ
jgi:hypothetical protein